MMYMCSLLQRDKHEENTDLSIAIRTVQFPILPKVKNVFV